MKKKVLFQLTREHHKTQSCTSNPGNQEQNVSLLITRYVITRYVSPKMLGWNFNDSANDRTTVVTGPWGTARAYHMSSQNKGDITKPNTPSRDTLNQELSVGVPPAGHRQKTSNFYRAPCFRIYLNKSGNPCKEEVVWKPSSSRPWNLKSLLAFCVLSPRVLAL